MTKAYDCALRLLARREHAADELCQKLASRGFSQTDIQAALNSCQEMDLQSDARFIENYCRSRIRQGYGPLRIKQELKKHQGLDSDLVAKILSNEDDNWQEYAGKVWQKRARGQSEWTISDLQKHQRFLLYRGFTADIIAKVMEEFKVRDCM